MVIEGIKYAILGRKRLGSFEGTFTAANPFLFIEQTRNKSFLSIEDGFNIYSDSCVILEGRNKSKCMNIQDEPKPAEPDVTWGSLSAKITLGLLAVGAVALIAGYAAMTVFTCGATAALAPYIACGVAGALGYMAVQNLAQSDIATQQESPWYEYINVGGGNAIVGAVYAFQAISMLFEAECMFSGILASVQASRMAKEGGNGSVKNGATRAAQYSSEWGNASLNDAVEKFAPNVEPVVTSKGKVIYNNTETGISVVYDKNGNYFRIEDTTRPRGRNYLDINGNDMNNEVVNGKTRGRSKSDYQKATHFNNND